MVPISFKKKINLIKLRWILFFYFLDYEDEALDELDMSIDLFVGDFCDLIVAVLDCYSFLGLDTCGSGILGFMTIIGILLAG